MKIYRKGSFLFTVLLLVFVLVIIWTSLGYRVKVGFVPLVVGIVGLILAILLLIGERYPKLIRGFDVSLTDLATKVESAEHRLQVITEQVAGRRVLTVCAWGVGFFILIYLVGYLIAIPVFVLLSVKIYGRIRWLNTLLITITVGGFIYLAFEVFMRIDLFRGILFGEILPPI